MLSLMLSVVFSSVLSNCPSLRSAKLTVALSVCCVLSAACVSSIECLLRVVWLCAVRSAMLIGTD